MRKIGWGMVGGGEDSQIGNTHRMAAGLDGAYHLCAGALDIDSARGQEFAQRLGIEPGRAYANWRDMLAGEKDRQPRCDLITIATPNSTHFEIASAFMSAGFHVLCEKPMTVNSDEAISLKAISEKTGRICAVNFGYSGYPMVRQMRDRIRQGQLGELRVVFCEFAGGFFADADESNNPRIRWRFDPAQAGISAITLDAGIHALHMACFVTGQKLAKLSADFASTVPGRQLEDDSLIAFRMEGGCVGRCWSSGVAIGRAHGLRLQVFGEKGGMMWEQEHPNQLTLTALGGNKQIIERANSFGDMEMSASRLPIGHSEGMIEAFANIYKDVALSISEGKIPRPGQSSFPDSESGLHTIQIIEAAAESARQDGAWIAPG